LAGVGARSCRQPGDGALHVDVDQPDNSSYSTLLVNLLQIQRSFEIVVALISAVKK
jgi:hypothetical protein